MAMIAISMPPALEVKFREKVERENLTISKAGTALILRWLEEDHAAQAPVEEAV
jgi:hypothetical protein